MFIFKLNFRILTDLPNISTQTHNFIHWKCLGLTFSLRWILDTTWECETDGARLE
jgi:hypothetical protein